MPVETDLYDILEVSTTASMSEIKRAYRKQALKHHPDKGGNEETFKKLNAAYEVLSDSQKKEMYDRYGKNGLKSSGAVPDDVLSAMFGDMFGGLGGIFNVYKNMRNAIRKSPTVIHRYSVSLEDLCTRKIAKLRFTRNRICPCVDDNKTSTCIECTGKGIKIQSRQIGPGMYQQIQSSCNRCQGNGKIYPSCDKCNGGLRELPKTFQLHLTPELENGYKYVFKGEGNQGHGQDPGDFIVIVVRKPHSFYSVNGKNLVCTIQITLKEALCGFERKLIHPGGEPIQIKENGVMTPTTNSKVIGRGLTDNAKLNINYKIDFPTDLPAKTIKILQEVLP